MTTKPGTLGWPAETFIPVELYTDETCELPALCISIDFRYLDTGDGTRWEYDHVLSDDGGEVTLICHPAAEDEGWRRLDEVGEW